MFLWYSGKCLNSWSIFRWFFLHLVLIFGFWGNYRIETYQSVHLVCYTYRWSYGCCLVVQYVDGDVWAVEEVTEIRKRVQLIQYKWRDTELLLSFYGLHTAATATEFCFRGFAVLGFSWVGQLGYFENDVALLTAIHLTTADELFSILPQKSNGSFESSLSIARYSRKSPQVCPLPFSLQFLNYR